MNRWTAIIPIKPWALAKSRLLVNWEVRAQLAEAFVSDVLGAVAGASLVDSIVIVSAEGRVHALARTAGAAVIEDRPLIAKDSLNRAILAGVAWSRTRRPCNSTVVVPGDLPALTSGSLDEVIGLLSEHRRAHVPDASGAGTTLLSAIRPSELEPAYGRFSATRHVASGSVPIRLAHPRVRRDVDTRDDLTWAVDLGVGPATAHALEAIERRGRGGSISTPSYGRR